MNVKFEFELKVLKSKPIHRLWQCLLQSLYFWYMVWLLCFAKIFNNGLFMQMQICVWLFAIIVLYKRILLHEYTFNSNGTWLLNTFKISFKSFPFIILPRRLQNLAQRYKQEGLDSLRRLKWSFEALLLACLRYILVEFGCPFLLQTHFHRYYDFRRL